MTKLTHCKTSKKSRQSKSLFLEVSYLCQNLLSALKCRVDIDFNFLRYNFYNEQANKKNILHTLYVDFNLHYLFSGNPRGTE
jgi:hypothetical protein